MKSCDRFLMIFVEFARNTTSQVFPIDIEQTTLVNEVEHLETFSAIRTIASHSFL